MELISFRFADLVELRQRGFRPFPDGGLKSRTQAPTKSKSVIKELMFYVVCTKLLRGLEHLPWLELFIKIIYLCFILFKLINRLFEI